MGELHNIYSKTHSLTKRDTLARMNIGKIDCMKIAKKYAYDYWDGDRKYGYGGYKYIPGRWSSIASFFVKYYNLKPGSKVLDIGCGKGFLLYELKLLIPDLKIVGFDISEYAIINSKEEIKDCLFIHDAKKPLMFDSKEFDLVVSTGVFHNLYVNELSLAVKEVNRISKNAYILVESYRNEKELFNLQCWGLTAVSLFTDKEWVWLYDLFGYKGDYEFFYF